MADCFPRSKDVPPQSPLFWVTHKDRYLRQLLIQDIQAETGRDLIVYFTECERSEAQIDPGDDVFFAELLKGCQGRPVDLLLETNGGFTDSTEKICAQLRISAPDLRVIVPRRAKSNGTVIALCGSEILMGMESELGPIDPFVQGIPADFVLKDPQAFNAVMVQLAVTAQQQTCKLAKSLLASGMMKGSNQADLDDTINKLATRDHYHSHGSVIDMNEASQLRLTINKQSQQDTLWQKIWLLRTMYQYDCLKNGYAKLFEGKTVSSAIASLPPQSPANP